MKKIMPIVLCGLVLVGCASEVEIKQHGYDQAMAAANIVCNKSYAAADLGELRKKINYTNEQTTLEYLTNNTYATEADKPYILLNDKLSRACWKDIYDITLKWFDPEYAAVVKDGSALMAQNRADLYNGKITYGEYNKLIIQLNSKYDQRMIALDSKNENIAMQRHQQIFNATSRMYVPPQIQAPQRNTVRCTTYGQFTNCSSY